jgi:hypothetical protein
MRSTATGGQGQALGIVWCGTRTGAFEATVGFFERVLGLPAGARRPHFCRLDLPDASAVEVFDAASGAYPHFVTARSSAFRCPTWTRPPSS